MSLKLLAAAAALCLTSAAANADGATVPGCIAGQNGVSKVAGEILFDTVTGLVVGVTGVNSVTAICTAQGYELAGYTAQVVRNADGSFAVVFDPHLDLNG